MKQINKLLKVLMILFVSTVLIQKAYCQIQIDSTKTLISKDVKSAQKIKKYILPLSLIGVGALLNKSKIEQNLQTKVVGLVGPDFDVPIDDALLFAPIVELYVADIAGVKAKNHWFDQSKYLFMANLFSTSITLGLKKIIRKTRPNLEPYSFPSGHTTIAFTNGAVLYKEFHETAPILAYSGYASAVTVGSFRLLNNKHWLSDVIVGAGIGILATEIIYHIKPFASFNPFLPSKNITFSPQVSDDSLGFYFSVKW